MPENSIKPRVVRVFLASPSDVSGEREALAHLISEINDVLAYLAPEMNLKLELVRYETHAYPDVGTPQEVINQQIPVDYDIFIGVMWKRCGTPTKSDSSGTVEEFWRAYKQRSSGHLPKIMFYFCEQMIPVPNSDELRQLQKLVDFKEKLSTLGLISTYPSHEEFCKHVRGGLLLAIRDILIVEANGKGSNLGQAIIEPVNVTDKQEILSLAAEYDQIRQEMPPGSARTRRMTDLVSAMKAKAASVRSLLPQLQQSNSAGQRLAAITILQMFPTVEELEWLAQCLNPDREKPFIGYQSATALLQAVRSLPATQCTKLRDAITEAMQLAQRLTTDPPRIQVLSTAQHELDRKCPNK
jgi:hypothetical protein